MVDKINQMSLKAFVRVQNGIYFAKEKIKSERGDTNFISIIIILGIVVVLAALFIGFKDQIVGKVQDMIKGFTNGWKDNVTFDPNATLPKNGG